jgi:hypothetical protein
MLWRDLLVPISAIAGGLFLSLLGLEYAATAGERFVFGPVGLGWITIPMVGLGSAALLSRLFHRLRTRSLDTHRFTGIGD